MIIVAVAIYIALLTLSILFSVPSKPCSLEVASVTSYSVTLQWIRPEPHNGVITRYSIQYDGRVINNFGSKSGNLMMGTMEGLSPNTEYVVQLKAHTRVGSGLSSNLAVKTCKLLYIN